MFCQLWREDRIAIPGDAPADADKTKQVWIPIAKTLCTVAYKAAIRFIELKTRLVWPVLGMSSN